MHIGKAHSSIAILGACLLASSPALAAPSGAGALALATDATVSIDAPIIEAQFRGVRGRGYRGGGRRGGGLGGAAAAIGVLGVIGAIAAQQQQQQIYGDPGYGYQQAPVYGGDGVQYCINRFRSYNPRTGTYRGNDGRNYACP